MSILALVITYIIIGILFNIREAKRNPIPATTLVKFIGSIVITLLWLPILVFQALT